MIKILITLTSTIREIPGIRLVRLSNHLQIFSSRLGKLLGKRTGCSAYGYTDAGGHMLRTLILGRGGPAVVFETGGYPANGASLEAWRRVQPEVSKFAATFSYDRAGIGLSRPGPKPRDARQIAGELRTALQNARVPAPYILVGHSFGGPLIRVFAGQFPEDVCGLVLVDPTQEEFIQWHGERAPHSSDEEWQEIQTCLDQAHASRVPDGIPVVLITAMAFRLLPVLSARKERQKREKFQPVWHKFHEEWVSRQQHARHLTTHSSGHSINYEEPRLVVGIIREMVEQIRLKLSAPAAPV